MRRAARTDANQLEIIKAFRLLGCTVEPLHQVGSGVPDLLVGQAGRNHLVEVKDGSKPPSERKLTPDQEDWHQNWNGTVFIVKSVDEVLMLVHQWRTEL